LNNLGAALDDIKRGNSSTLFKPSVQNRPLDPTRLLSLKAASAAAMQLLMDSGKSKKDAAIAVARKLHSAGFRLSNSKAANPGTIARWRDRFNGHSDDDEGADVYRFALETARDAHKDPAHQAQIILRRLKRMNSYLKSWPVFNRKQPA
jgi:hypothetical protein